MPKTFFITGIGTNIGKTIVSSILTEALQADYWKPIQAGSLGNTDEMIVSGLISNSKTVIHPPSYLLKTPASPHFAAEKENVEIELSKINLPPTSNNLIIEGAGGLMVPLNNKELVIDLVQQLNARVILVVKNYLGAINHTLLSLEVLKSRNIKVAGIIFNGGDRLENTDYIEKYSKLPILGLIPELEVLNKETISKEAAKFVGLNTKP